MPYIKSVCVHADVKSSLVYILNPEKTEDTLYTASLNCLTNAEDAYLLALSAALELLYFCLPIRQIILPPFL